MSAVRKSVFAIGSIPPLRSLCAEHLSYIEIRVVDDVGDGGRGDGRAGKGVHLGQVCADSAGCLDGPAVSPASCQTGRPTAFQPTSPRRAEPAPRRPVHSCSGPQRTASGVPRPRRWNPAGAAARHPEARPFRAERVSPAAYILRVASASGEVSDTFHCAGSKSCAAADASDAPAAA